MLLIKHRQLHKLTSRQYISLLQYTKHTGTSSEGPVDDALKKQRFALELDRNIEERFLEGEFKARYHPGVMSVKCIQLPAHIMEAVDTISKERTYSKNVLLKDAQKLEVYISNRRPVHEDEELRQALNKAATKLVNEGKLDSKFFEDGSEKNVEDMSKDDLVKLRTELKKAVYNWKPIDFNQYMSFVYLIARAPADYAALVRIFSEIKTRRKDFTPKTLFDFGSGVGTASWALDAVWPEECKEYYNVDSSSSMLELSELLLKEGVTTNPGPDRLKSTYFRQFLPSSSSLQYDLVVSSRTMFEIGNMNARAKTADILWKKVALGGFLVLVEAGTMAGYSILLEIRDYLLEISKVEREKYSIDTPVHVFSPCPHDQFCPRYSHKSNTACHFTVKYISFLSSSSKKEKFSYIVLQKRERKEEEEWPRIVQGVLKRHNHIICRTCTSGGCIRELVITKGKHGKICYQVCKNSSWGDFLPVTITDNIDNSIDPEDPKFNKEGDLIGQSEVESKQDFSVLSMDEKATA